MYQHILLATELSDDSRLVEDQAAKLQKLSGAKLSVIHIVEPILSVAAVGEIAIPVDYYETEESLIAAAKKLIQPVIKRLDIPEANSVIGVGRVSYEILLYAEKKNVDLIVTGSHGRHGLQLLLGSTANAILHGAKCDVLAVRLKNEK
jgi:universal stress protein A